MEQPQIEEVEQPQVYSNAVCENIEEAERVIDNNDQRKPEPFSENERIKHILIMANGDAKRAKELFARYKISEDSLRTYANTY